MALVYQYCESCGIRYASRTVRSKTCSSACRQRACRAAKQQSATPATQPTIKTEGNKSMSNKSTTPPMQFAFSQPEYEARCENEIAFYKSRIEKPYEGVFGAIVESSPSNLTLRQSLDYYHQMLSAGYTPLEEMSVLPTAILFESPLGSFITIYLMKPDAQQESDCVKIRQQVKSQYEAELEAALNAEIDRQVAMSLAKDERDRQQAEQKQRLSREQEVRDELAASRGLAREELIKSGKLSADGSAA